MNAVKAQCENIDDFSDVDALKEHRFETGEKGDFWKEFTDKFLLAQSFRFVHYDQESHYDEIGSSTFTAI